MTLTFSLDKNTLRSFYLHENRQTFIGWGALCLVMLVIMAFLFSIYTVLLAAASVLLFAYYCLKIYFVYRKSLKSVKLDKPVTVKLTAANFSVTDGAYEGKPVMWERMYGVTDTKTLTVVRVTRRVSVIIPKSAVDADAAALLAKGGALTISGKKKASKPKKKQQK